MNNFQVRALTLLAGFGLVFAKSVEYALSDNPPVHSFYIAPFMTAAALGMTFAYFALQATEDESRFRRCEHWALRVAVFIGFSITLYAMFGRGFPPHV
jgi:hypothetical protein